MQIGVRINTVDEVVFLCSESNFPFVLESRKCGKHSFTQHPAKFFYVMSLRQVSRFVRRGCLYRVAEDDA